MCGLVGFWNRNGLVAQESIINNMLQIIKHRGPDDEGLFLQNDLALGHVRLSIVDLSNKGRQAFVTSDNKGVLVYNGELYNYKELKRQLELEGVEFKSQTDTEVFLYALHNWGVENAVKKFNGMFAFAYFDFRYKELWLGRDRMGIKPLYYTIQNGNIIFASEIKAILEHPKVNCEPDVVALSTHISYEYLEGKWTCYKNVFSILPGSLCRVKQNTLEEIIYFDVIDNINVDMLQEPYGLSADGCVSEFQTLIKKSVGAHLIGDAPIATFCSGGVDSSLITAYAKEMNNNIISYVANVEDALPEAQKAKEVGKYLGVDIRVVNYSTEEYLYDWAKSIWFNDMPPVYRSDQAFMAIAKQCKRDGIKVVLTGEGADELFGGYEWHEDAYNIWHYRKHLIKFMKRFNPEQLRWHFSKSSFSQLYNKYLAFFAPIDMETLEQRTFARFPTPNPNNVHQILRRACVEDGAQRMIRHERLLSKLEPIKRRDYKALLAIGYDDMYGHLMNLLQRNDRMGMAASVESRIPFLDNELIDFSIRLNPKYKYYKKERKWIVKKAASKLLPSNIVYAPKMGFSTSKKPYKYAIPLIREGMVP